MFSILLAGLVFFINFVKIMSFFCVSNLYVLFYVLYYFDVLCLIPGPNWKTVFTLSFVTQAKEVLIK